MSMRTEAMIWRGGCPCAGELRSNLSFRQSAEWFHQHHKGQ